ncbi:hypothetical protein E2C01_058675 [Portunus trituberculatus]|uniref:Uncharacterized protein n=1 Tax=Portunus trituberculatus TaxID=210409 RepID=A0A5B7H5D5_PORTR|nr:hypothetical protein [Portunus trituberculatus]
MAVTTFFPLGLFSPLTSLFGALVSF